MVHQVRRRKQRTIERLFVRYVVNQQNTHGASVVGRCDGSESFLSGGIPLYSPEY
jgi:hypothetical protein